MKVLVNNKEHEATTNGKGKYELHYFRIHGATVSTCMDLSQIEVCVNLHRTKLGLFWDEFCKGLTPLSIQLVGWRITGEY